MRFEPQRDNHSGKEVMGVLRRERLDGVDSPTLTNGLPLRVVFIKWDDWDDCGADIVSPDGWGRGAEGRCELDGE